MMKKAAILGNSYKFFKFFDDIKPMKKFTTIFLTVAIGMLFAGCTFKAELDSRVVSGHSAQGSAYTPVLSECGNDDSR